MLCIDLKGKTALITGASGELGRTIAKKLALCGADIIICYGKGRDRAEALKREIESTSDVNCYTVSADISDTSSVFLMKDEIERCFKLPDIIVTAAVAQYQWKNLLDQPIEDYISQFNTCVLHNVNIMKAFVPHMKDNKYGKIVGINTECSMRCGVTESAYDSAKRGMDGIFRVLAKEVGEYNITVNQVAPGWTISDRDRANGTEIAPEYSKSVPLARRGTDDEIANAVAFLASDLSSFITGAFLPVCGGAEMPAI